MMTDFEKLMRSAIMPSIPEPPAITNLQNSLIEAKRKDEHRQAMISGRFDAQDTHQYLMMKVDEFQKKLAANEEAGIQLANFGLASQIHIRSISFQNPNLIEFHGVNAEGHEVSLIQHISQLNFMLIAVRSFEEKAFRMGFVWPQDQNPT